MRAPTRRFVSAAPTHSRRKHCAHMITYKLRDTRNSVERNTKTKKIRAMKEEHEITNGNFTKTENAPQTKRAANPNNVVRTSNRGKTNAESTKKNVRI